MVLPSVYDELRFEELCQDLNMDMGAKQDALNSYKKIVKNYTLEGDALHWLVCALYVSGRRSLLQTVDGQISAGNHVSLTRLLRSAKMSLYDFFKKIKVWHDMANLPVNFRDCTKRLERNFAVSAVIFEKFTPIFIDIFAPTACSSSSASATAAAAAAKDAKPRCINKRKQRRNPCDSEDIHKFCWTMFILVKGNFPALSDDLVNSYHLLLCCIDWVYTNIRIADRSDLLNSSSAVLRSEKGEEPDDILDYLIRSYEAISIEVKGIREHWWRPYIHKLYTKISSPHLKGKVEDLSGAFDTLNYDINFKSISHAYEEYVLTRGDFDERLFLRPNAEQEIASHHTSDTGTHDNMITNNEQSSRTMAPKTPLTGRRYLSVSGEAGGGATCSSTFTSSLAGCGQKTPITAATQSVQKLHRLLAGMKSSSSEILLELFCNCERNPHLSIIARVKRMGAVFCTNYTQTSDVINLEENIARKRLKFAECLYYKSLEKILQNERRRLTTLGRIPDLSMLLEQEEFHSSLFACCLEVVIFSYNAQRTFPWVLDTFHLSAFNFYKVIEIFIRINEALSRDVIKHLNRVEETILESLAWKSDSEFWLNKESLKSCEQVSLPGQIAQGSVVHPAVKRITEIELEKPRSPFITDRFVSATNTNSMARRNLFSSSATTGATTPHTTASPTKGMGSMTLTAREEAQNDDNNADSLPSNLPPFKRMTSTSLFLRKIYRLASVRLRDLCDKLSINDDLLLSQIWTCFEYVLKDHTEILKDRHLDQILMCCLYVIAKVTNKDESFQAIMKEYRVQPQALSHVYRSVLLDKDSKLNESLTLSSDRKCSPTKASGIGQGSFKVDNQIENRGDLICFYNSVFMKYVKTFALRFSVSNGKNNTPMLSPLPSLKSRLSSPKKLMSNIHISPHKRCLDKSNSSTEKLLYCFNMSPANDLLKINQMVRTRRLNILSAKKLETSSSEDICDSPCKRMRDNSFVSNRLKQVITDRKAVKSKAQI